MNNFEGNENREIDAPSFRVNMLPVETVRTRDDTEQKSSYHKLLNLKRRIRIFPFLKKSISHDVVLKWKDQPLKEALSAAAAAAAAASKKYTKFVSDLDEMIRKTVTEDELHLDLDLVNKYLHIGVFEEGGKLRDEIYLQILRQIKGNPKEIQVERAWRLMICVTGAFPPSKGLFSWIQYHLSEENHGNNNSTNNNIRLFMKCCASNLNVFNISGPRGYSTSIEDVNFWFNDAYNEPGVFGVDLEEIYEHLELLDEYNGVTVPKLVITLLRMIVDLGGFKKEGIFRISGDLQQVFKLKNYISMNTPMAYFGDQIKDPSVPCSTLKLWMRVLKEPLIPDNLYLQFLNARNDHLILTELLKDNLPKPNYSVISTIINFLLELSQEEWQEYTKMGLNNFAMIFAPCFMRCPLSLSPTEILQKSGEERELIRSLFDHFQHNKINKV